LGQEWDKIPGRSNCLSHSVPFRMPKSHIRKQSSPSVGGSQLSFPMNLGVIARIEGMRLSA
jgi:hypothetical protein